MAILGSFKSQQIIQDLFSEIVLVVSTPALHPHQFFLQMLEKIDFEPVSDKTKFVAMNIFAVAEDVLSKKLVLNSAVSMWS